LTYRLASRLTPVDAKQLADTIATDFTMGTANPAFKKVLRLEELGQGEESDLFEVEDLQLIAIALESPAFVERYPEGYAELRAEVTRILKSGR
jgi:hypothetical protein